MNFLGTDRRIFPPLICTLILNSQNKKHRIRTSKKKKKDKKSSYRSIYIYKTQSKNGQKKKKWAEGLKKHFYKEDIQMAKRHIRCSVLLIIKEMQVKTTVRYDLTWIRMAIIKKCTNNKW